MSVFDDLVTAHVLPSAAVFYGETVRYVSSGEEPRDVTAIAVNRGPTHLRGTEMWPGYDLTLTLSRADVAHVFPGSDTVVMRRKVDDDPATMRVASILEQSDAHWILALS